jgi:hypothetical protein
VPLGATRESPNPTFDGETASGHPISIDYGDPNAKIRGVVAKLRIPGSERPVPFWISSPGTGHHRGTIVLHPRDELEPWTCYEVSVDLVKGGEEVHLEWRFYTGRRSLGFD